MMKFKKTKNKRISSEDHEPDNTEEFAAKANELSQ